MSPPWTENFGTSPSCSTTPLLSKVHWSSLILWSKCRTLIKRVLLKFHCEDASPRRAFKRDDVEMREKRMDWMSAYQERLPVLARVAEDLQATLAEILCGVPRIDRITTRVKTIDSFVGKAQRIDPDAGKPRYTYPFDEIQDQIGARI